MRRLACTALAVAAGMLALPACTYAQSAPAAGALEQVAWVSGCWEGSSSTDQVEEHWLPLRAGTLVGVGRGTRGDRTTSVELTIIRMRGDTLAYHAFPIGQQPAVFPAESVSDSAVSFANPQHDFPQRIIYRRVGRDSLIARVEGPGEHGVVGFDYNMRRAECPGAPRAP
jgi:hypothetical protein